MTAAAGLFAALAAGAADASTGQQAGLTRTAAAQVPVLSWKACHDGFQCTTARVPLDYRHPGGAKISIAVVRHPATDRARRLGSLFGSVAEWQPGAVRLQQLWVASARSTATPPATLSFPTGTT